ncbi:unnamed protein product [Toxocara canis]|uniref:Ovule protein n=1 Tax=Toxocara canis TaxID=6265 RepID=A0A183UC61_TOXCA|nr:unnamed protein product [Toxocara canis]
MNFVVLRNVGTDECQVWQKFNLNVRVSCECFVGECLPLVILFFYVRTTERNSLAECLCIGRCMELVNVNHYCYECLIYTHSYGSSKRPQSIKHADCVKVCTHFRLGKNRH